MDWSKCGKQCKRSNFKKSRYRVKSIEKGLVFRSSLLCIALSPVFFSCREERPTDVLYRVLILSAILSNRLVRPWHDSRLYGMARRFGEFSAQPYTTRSWINPVQVNPILI
ncbi:hypothetical protein GYMLUDRAFT_676894 [Collybiopsis luxurians FD-317 M1]|uniref:Uncharacterized protein n=1 Tax=Collybiopsis luxurians FD-317 M1 TaxID=944289 RepID=A0A0D0CA11_9AGAR|nr:hypothetical protein GYMLUDRAFT_676894 [Collybiopsis luxurians FD-317 M1]